MPGRDDDLRRHARRRAVVLEAERLEHRLRILTFDVLEVEGVAVDQLAVAKRKHLHRRPVGLGSDADHVHRPDGPLVGCLPLGEASDREQAVPVARRLLVALLGRGVAHLPLQLADDRLRVAGEERDHAVDDLPVASPDRSRPRTAPCSARCGSRGRGSPNASPASAPRTAGTGRPGSARRASRAPSSHSRTGRSRRSPAGAARA